MLKALRIAALVGIVVATVIIGATTGVAFSFVAVEILRDALLTTKC